MKSLILLGVLLSSFASFASADLDVQLFHSKDKKTKDKLAIKIICAEKSESDCEKYKFLAINKTKNQITKESDLFPQMEAQYRMALAAKSYNSKFRVERIGMATATSLVVCLLGVASDEISAGWCALTPIGVAFDIAASPVTLPLEAISMTGRKVKKSIIKKRMNKVFSGKKVKSTRLKKDDFNKVSSKIF